MSIWDKYPNFTDEELRDVVAITAQVLLESETVPADLNQDILKMSPLAISGQLSPILQKEDPSLEKGQVQQLLEDEETSTQISLKLLEEVRKYPEIADRVAAAYEARSKKMVVAETMLLTGALVVLAMKLKEIRWSKKEKVIKFDKAGKEVKSFIVGLLKGIV
ncbi:MAG: hypothetical protein DMF68_11585 [Acidobacteria bacterium]|nr:MAG: hypothetical protein DMF68_11585 [Acidobacteriota bacterium]